MARSDVAGICFLSLLYVVPIALVISKPGARRDILLRTARFVATWGVALCVAAGFVGGAMSGLVGLIGAPLGMFPWVFWAHFVTLQSAAVQRESQTNGVRPRERQP